MAKRKFRPLPSPIGSGWIDEKATHEAFVEYVGGRQRADRLLWLWSNSYPGIRVSVSKEPPNRQGVFRRKAKQEGFTDNEIDAFLAL